MADLEVVHECTVGDSSEIVVGESFSSFEELQERIERYKQESFVELWRRDSRTIAAARKRGYDRPINSSLRYRDVKYCCVHGGQTFKPRGTGQRCTA